jgi:hypothetical protein
LTYRDFHAKRLHSSLDCRSPEQFQMEVALNTVGLTNCRPSGVQSKNGESQRRNWREHNESFVKRGEIYLTFDFLESRDGDLEKLNREKLGRKYASPWSFIELLMMIHVIFRLPYRQIECFLRKLSGLIPEIKSANYTNIWRHAAKPKVGLQDTISSSDKPIVISIGCTGIKMTFGIFAGLCLMDTIFSLARGNLDRIITTTTEPVEKLSVKE